MDRDQHKFISGILNTIMRSAIHTTLWRLPLWLTIGLGVLAAGSIWYFKLF
jgi:hypothetical protein